MDLALSIAIPLGLGAASGWATRAETRGAWYESLRKPSWQPPRWVFGPVWTLLYVLMGLAAWRVWRVDGFGVPLGLYAVQLALNLAWTFVFFKYKNLRLALAEILALLATIVATIVSFASVDATAAAMLLPYAAWVTFATLLTARLYRDNRDR